MNFISGISRSSSDAGADCSRASTLQACVLELVDIHRFKSGIVKHIHAVRYVA